MRLIDADELEKLLSPALTGKTEYSADELLLTITSLPTIKSIPYCWIDRYMQMFQYNGVIREEYMTLFNMLCDWECEND